MKYSLVLLLLLLVLSPLSADISEEDFLVNLDKQMTILETQLQESQMELEKSTQLSKELKIQLNLSQEQVKNLKLELDMLNPQLNLLKQQSQELKNSLELEEKALKKTTFSKNLWKTGCLISIGIAIPSIIFLIFQ